MGHWNRLVETKMSNVLIDWTRWIDEDEETELMANPYGHAPESMAAAMGNNWGSNVDRNLKAREQGAKVDTSPDQTADTEDAITMG